MTTGEKLSLLMELFGVNTRKLARAIHVDPSSVSRWANDRRTLKNGSEFVEKIAGYFLNVQAYDILKQKLVELLLPGAPMHAVDPDALERRFREWLLFEDRPPAAVQRADTHTAETMAGEHIRALLGSLGELSAASPDLFPPDLPATLQPGKTTEVEIYSGDEGIRQALLGVASALALREAPGELLITSQDDLSWYMKPDFLQKWMQTVGAVLHKGRVRVIFRLNRGMGSILTLIHSWLPMILTGRVEAMYYTRYQEPVIAMTLAVAPGSAAMFSLKSQSDDHHGCTYVYRDAASVEHYRMKFLDLVSVSQRLIRVYSQADIPVLQQETTLLEERSGDAMLCSRGLNPLLLPMETYGRLLERTKLDAGPRAARLALHLRRQEAFRNALSAGACRDICPMETLDRMASPRGFRYDALDLYSHEDVPAVPAEILEHLQRTLDMLDSQPNYRLALTSLEGIFEENIRYWQLKADAAAIVCTQSLQETFAVDCREGTVLQGFSDYFNDLWDSIPAIDRDREAVKRRIAERIERLKNQAANGT